MGFNVRWTIGVVTVPARRELCKRLLAQIEPQIEPYNDIELLVLEDNRKRELGPKLQAVVDIAQGEYVSFLDDDDLISDDYVESFYPFLDGVDAVGFTGQVSVEGGPWRNVSYSKDYGWEENSGGFLRPHQHLSPIKTDIVRQVRWDAMGHYGCDFRWSKTMRESGLIRTENVVEDKVLYYYFASQTENREGVWV